MNEYPEYEQLQALRAEDRRRRAAASVHFRVDDQLSAGLRAAIGEIGFQAAVAQLRYQLRDAQKQAARLRELPRHPMTCQARWYRRSMARIAHQYDAIARSARRDLVVLQRPARPVIKKGLTR